MEPISFKIYSEIIHKALNKSYDQGAGFITVTSTLNEVQLSIKRQIK